MSERTADALEEALTRIKDLEAKLVERDVYEAQQILPPEQAALIKHLATVERCIEEGRFDDGYDADRYCLFCSEYIDNNERSHTKNCAWLALQFDRKPAETMALVEGWAWEENESWERRRRVTPREPSINNMLGLSAWLKNAWPIERVEPLSADEMRGHFTLQPDTHFPDAPVPATVIPDEAPQHPGLEGPKEDP